MIYIYSRVSTDKQDTNNQLAKLKGMFPDASLHEETASSGKERPVLKKLIATLEKGDVLVVAALDRLGRKTSEILLLIEDLDRKGVILKSIREGVDYSTIAGRLVTQILCSVAEMEKNLISERTKAALAAKRAKGIVGGRRAKYGPELIAEIKKLRFEQKSLREISEKTGVSISRICQLTKDEAA